jgi:hypothetical protein
MPKRRSTIDTILQKVRDQEYEFTIPHFFEEMANDSLIFADVERAVLSGRNPAAIYTRPTRHSIRDRRPGDR